MQNLKLNQLNKQKMTEREMNVIEGGMPYLPAEFKNYDELFQTDCYSHCTDSQYVLHRPSYDNFGGVWSESYY
jgi:hypothetical protein